MTNLMRKEMAQGTLAQNLLTRTTNQPVVLNVVLNIDPPQSNIP
jgi:hypothetical protein